MYFFAGTIFLAHSYYLLWAHFAGANYAIHSPSDLAIFSLPFAGIGAMLLVRSTGLILLKFPSRFGHPVWLKMEVGRKEGRILLFAGVLCIMHAFTVLLCILFAPPPGAFHNDGWPLALIVFLLFVGVFSFGFKCVIRFVNRFDDM